MSKRGSTPLSLVILIKFLANTILVWAMATYMSEYFVLTGDWIAIVVIGALLTLLNLFLRPILAIITFPLKLFATLLALVLIQAVFIYITVQITSQMDPAVLTFSIGEGLVGWGVVAVVFGLGNWVTKLVLR